MTWHLEIVARDDEGRRLMLDKYKPFRLTALRVDPSSFSSTLAREVAFDDAVWTSRLMDPLNHVIVCIEDTGARDIVSSIFVRMLPERAGGPSNSGVSPTYGLFGLWTAPRMRRQGIAQALLGKATELVGGLAAEQGTSAILVVEAIADNETAIALYRRMGFGTWDSEQEGLVSLRKMVQPRERHSPDVAPEGLQTL